MVFDIIATDLRQAVEQISRTGQITFKNMPIAAMHCQFFLA